MEDLKDLKSKAYDLIAGIERAQMMLKQINDQIMKLSQELAQNNVPLGEKKADDAG